MRREASRVSSLMCPFCVRALLLARTTDSLEQVAQPTRHFWQCTSSTGLPSIRLLSQSTSFSPLTSSS
jgi:hypothetical protein